MNNDPNQSKAQVIDKLKSANNVLVAVSADPSIDQLAACIAVTLALNKYKKSATAVFSGKVPSVLEFLKPKDTLVGSTDSLRDFIIALDKSKADKLRYKVEDDVVKIFITPYKTSITESDLKYSAGDFNVDVILALGVQHQQDLDTAVSAHGRIFHDAVTVSMNNIAGGDFGVAHWEDFEASSLSELVSDLVQALDPHLLDAQIATALLTGIVAETSRFSNEKTHPQTMAVSSMLLQAGADQQLVNTELQEVIGTVVNLVAGTEIKPTVTVPQESESHPDASEELIVDENGDLKTESADEPKIEKHDQPLAEKPSSEQPIAERASETEASAADKPADILVEEPAEKAAGEPVAQPVSPTEPSQTPKVEKIEADPATPPAAVEPVSATVPVVSANDNSTAAAARQAVEDALSSISNTDDSAAPSPSGESPMVFEKPEPHPAPVDTATALPTPPVSAPSVQQAPPALTPPTSEDPLVAPPPVVVAPSASQQTQAPSPIAPPPSPPPLMPTGV